MTINRNTIESKTTMWARRNSPRPGRFGQTDSNNLAPSQAHLRSLESKLIMQVLAASELQYSGMSVRIEPWDRNGSLLTCREKAPGQWKGADDERMESILFFRRLHAARILLHVEPELARLTFGFRRLDFPVIRFDFINPPLFRAQKA